MQLSEIIPKLEALLKEHGDMPFTATVFNSCDMEEDPLWGQDLRELIISDVDGFKYCDYILETDMDYRKSKENKTA